MGAIIETIVNLGTKLFPFLSSIGVWFSSFSTFFNLSTFINVFVKLKYVLMAIPLISIIVLAFTLFITAFMNIYNLINDFISTINSQLSSTDTILNCVIYIMSITGFIDGIKSSLPIFFTVLSYYVLRLLFANAIKFYSFFLEFVNNLTFGK